MKNTAGANGRANAAGKTVGKTARRARAIVDRTAQAASAAARDVQPVIDRAAALAHKAVDKTSSAADWIDAHLQELNIDQQKLLTDARKYIEKNPFKAVAGAAVLGFLIARLVR